METVGTTDLASSAVSVQEAVAAVPLWYHTLELPEGVVTPGWFDLRPIVDRIPWPDVEGKRCLDVGTYDGFFAFELERRGAAEVVATDIADHTLWDWPVRMRAQGPERLEAIAGPEKGRGFRAAHAALGSRVDRIELSVYDLSPERVGSFDLVVCGSLMLHLRDPLRALAAIRSVCAGLFLSAEEIRLDLPLRASRRPLVELDGVSHRSQWWIPSAAGHLRMLEASGFEIVKAGPRYAIPFGVSHPAREQRPALADAFRRPLARLGRGVPHQAALARPV